MIFGGSKGNTFLPPAFVVVLRCVQDGFNPTQHAAHSVLGKGEAEYPFSYDNLLRG
jgi:hypothetical protein